MYKKNGKIYASAWHYLRHKTKKVVAQSVDERAYSTEDFEEVALERPGTFEVRGGRLWWGGRLFTCRLESLTYAAVKDAVVRSRYSEADQIAVMLNRENGGDDAQLYEEMQAWRTFAAEAAKAVSAGAAEPG